MAAWRSGELELSAAGRTDAVAWADEALAEALAYLREQLGEREPVVLLGAHVDLVAGDDGHAARQLVVWVRAGRGDDEGAHRLRLQGSWPDGDHALAVLDKHGAQGWSVLEWERGN